MLFFPFLFVQVYVQVLKGHRLGWKALKGEFNDCWTKWGSWRGAPPDLSQRVGEPRGDPTKPDKSSGETYIWSGQLLVFWNRVWGNHSRIESGISIIFIYSSHLLFYIFCSSLLLFMLYVQKSARAFKGGPTQNINGTQCLELKTQKYFFVSPSY